MTKCISEKVRNLVVVVRSILELSFYFAVNYPHFLMWGTSRDLSKGPQKDKDWAMRFCPISKHVMPCFIYAVSIIFLQLRYQSQSVVVTFFNVKPGLFQFFI